MGAKKDINRIKELIFGKEIVRFEERFQKLENELDDIRESQDNFQKMLKAL